jgi:hypothetical protein
VNEIEKLLKEKLASQGIDKDWLDSHLEVLTDDEDEEDYRETDGTTKEEV